MVEVIAVLLIIAVIVAVALIRGSGSSSNSISVVSEAATLESHLRFAQVKALGETTTWGIQVNSASYQLLNSGSPCNNLPNGSPCTLPAETSNTHTFAGGVTATPVTITFDNFGRPVDSSGNPLTTNTTITLTCGTQTAAANVLQTTGAIN